MTCVVDDPQFQVASRFYGSGHLAVDFPRREELAPELISPVEIDLVKPLHGSRGLHDEVVLAIVDHYWDVLGKKVFHPFGLLLHEVSVEVLVDLVCLRTEDNIFVKSPQLEVLRVFEVGLQEF